MKTLNDKISDGALCEYGNVLLIEDVKQKMDDAKNDITKRHNILVAHNDDSWSQGKADGFREAIEIIDKHLGKELK